MFYANVNALLSHFDYEEMTPSLTKLKIFEVCLLNE